VADESVTSGEAMSIEIDAPDLSLSLLIETTEMFSVLLREVSHEMLPDAPVRWLVERISMSSPLQLAVRPAASRRVVSPKTLNSLTETIFGGLETVQASPKRPPHFNDIALERAKSLAGTAAQGRHVRFGRKRGRGSHQRLVEVEVTSQFVANVDLILGDTISAIGTIEGRLEAFNMHGDRRYFIVYDDLTGARIQCDFGTRISVREIGEAAHRRVAVHGEIVYRHSGVIVRVKAQSLDVFPDETELPTADDVRGILNR
jgi:hypothetical protein